MAKSHSLFSGFSALLLCAGWLAAAAAVEVVILRPAAGDRVAAGSTVEVTFWVSEQTLVLAQVSVNAGNDWIGILPPMSCIPAHDTTTYTWEVNQEELTAGPALLRIVGYMDPNINAVSAGFSLVSSETAVGRATSRQNSLTSLRRNVLTGTHEQTGLAPAMVSGATRLLTVQGRSGTRPGNGTARTGHAGAAGWYVWR